MGILAMGAALIGAGVLLLGAAVNFFFESAQARDLFGTSFSMDLATIGAVLLAGGCIVVAIQRAARSAKPSAAKGRAN